MKERPILFSGPMVKAILDNRKTMTRRVVKPQPTGADINSSLDGKWLNKRFGGLALPKVADLPMECPYGQPGDRLWVRETWSVSKHHDRTSPRDLPYGKGLTTFYAAGGSRSRNEVGGPYVNDDSYPPDGVPDWAGKWRPSIHMPRVACRLVLEVTQIRAERLQIISEEDAKAEGLSRVSKDGTLHKYGIPDRDGLPGTDDYGWPWQDWQNDPREAFRHLWDGINSARGYGWDVNPWVWCVEFKRVQACS